MCCVVVKVYVHCSLSLQTSVEILTHTLPLMHVLCVGQQASAHRDETKKLKAYIVKIKKELADARGKAAAPSEEREDLQRQLEASVEAGQQR